MDSVNAIGVAVKRAITAAVVIIISKAFISLMEFELTIKIFSLHASWFYSPFA
jgi:hypothetical protein